MPRCDAGLRTWELRNAALSFSKQPLNLAVLTVGWRLLIRLWYGGWQRRRDAIAISGNFSITFKK